MKSLKTPLRYPGGKSRACTKNYPVEIVQRIFILLISVAFLVSLSQVLFQPKPVNLISPIEELKK